MLLLVMSVKLVAEIALMALLGQWLVGLLAGDKREHNVFYKLFEAMTSPFVGAARALMPALASERMVRRAAVLGLLVLWLASTAGKISLCMQGGVNVCR